LKPVFTKAEHPDQLAAELKNLLCPPVPEIVLALTGRAAQQQYAGSTVGECLEDMPRMQSAQTGEPNGAYCRRIGRAVDSGGLHTAVSIPVAAENNDASMRLHAVSPYFSKAVIVASICRSDAADMSMALDGHRAAQLPHPLQRSGSTWACGRAPGPLTATAFRSQVATQV